MLFYWPLPYFAGLLVWISSTNVPNFSRIGLWYSWLSLSWTRLSRITAYLEVKIWSLPKHENLTTCKNIVEKRRNCSLGAISPLFHNIFNISLTSRVQLHIYLLNVVNWISFFLYSANLICRSTDISKYFRKSIGIRDNESWLYFVGVFSYILGVIGMLYSVIVTIPGYLLSIFITALKRADMDNSNTF